MLHAASELYNDLLEIYDFNYLPWFEELDDVPTIPLLEDDEGEVTKEMGIKILTSNKPLTRLPVLLAQIKAGNNLYKLSTKSDK